jgi:poly(A) polymerase
MNWKPPNPAYGRLITALLADGRASYIVGGAVRDFLLNRDEPIVDLDVVVEGRALHTAKRVADTLGWAYYPMDTGRDVARLVFSTGQGTDLTCDIAALRGATIEDDLSARDFTINAMAVKLKTGESPVLLDPYGGQADLAARVLRRVSALSLSEDSIRLLRAVRLMVQFELSIDSTTYAQLERLSDTVRLGSAERARDELWRMMRSEQPRTAIELLDSFGLLRHVLPEVAACKGVEQSEPHYQNVFQHTLSAIDYAVCLRTWISGKTLQNADCAIANLYEMLAPYRFELRRHLSQDVAAGHARLDWLVWHALLHDIGKPAAATAEPTVAEPAPLSDSGAADEVRMEAQSATRSQDRIRFIGHETIGAGMAAERLAYLRFSRQEIEMSSAVISAHMRPHGLHASFPSEPISRRAVFRFFRDVGGKQFGRGLGVDTILLALADTLATYRDLPPDWTVYLAQMDQMLRDYFSPTDAGSTDVHPVVNGHILQKSLGISEGKQVGQLLNEILEAQAAGEVSTVDEALELARRLHRDATDAY